MALSRRSHIREDEYSLLQVVSCPTHKIGCYNKPNQVLEFQGIIEEIPFMRWVLLDTPRYKVGIAEVYSNNLLSNESGYICDWTKQILNYKLHKEVTKTLMVSTPFTILCQI